jgi:hypothetical protein
LAVGPCARPCRAVTGHAPETHAGAARLVEHTLLSLQPGVLCPQGPFRAQHTQAGKGPMCEHGGCTTHPIFGDPSDGVRRFCKTHKLDDHVDVMNKRCEHAGCDTRPNFGSPSDGISRCCKTHKLDDHVDLGNLSSQCTHDGCSTRASYGSEADDLLLLCGAHKRAGDVDLVKARCVVPGCEGPRSFGAAAEGVARYCKEHREPGHERRQLLRTRMRTLGAPPLL